MEKRKRQSIELSITNLPQACIINDPRQYLQKIRSTFIKKVREINNLNIDDIASKCNLTKVELERIEKGNISEQDMSTLFALATTYELDYPSLLFLYKLATLPAKSQITKLAAYHDQKINEDTLKDFLELVDKIKDSIK